MAKKATRARKRGAGGSAAGPRDPVDAALELAAVQGWRHSSLGDIAAAAGLSLAELYQRYPSKAALLAGFVQRIDAAVLAAGPADPGESVKDRLFDVIMRRLDALAPYKLGVRSILRDGWRDAASATPAALLPVWRSLEWMLAAAGLETGGLAGVFRRKGLALIYADVLRVWLNDDSTDMAKTMAALDRRLRQADSLMRLCRGRRRAEASDAAEEHT